MGLRDSLNYYLTLILQELANTLDNSTSKIKMLSADQRENF
jgi:hypothetical protein